MLAVESEESLQIVTDYEGQALIERIIEATRGYLCGLAAENPLTLIFDDLHWADEASLHLLLNLADLSGSQPALFICMLRPDKEAASWKFIESVTAKTGGHFHPITLEPLRVEQTDTLLSNLLGMADLPKTVRGWIAEKAQGNPFFVEELIRSLIETKQIIRENDHWRVASEEAKVSLPNTLRGVLGARIDRLPDETRHVLQMASVIGRSFDVDVLERLARSGNLEAHIEHLIQAGLIETWHTEYAFRHVLIQDAAYDSILMKQRAGLHLQVAEALEKLRADRVEEFAPLLAHHFYAARDQRSLKYDALAGEKAARLYANAEAAMHLSRALEVAKRIPAEAEQIGQLYTQFGAVLEVSGRYEQALAIYDEMQAFAREHNEPVTELNALMAKATIYSTPTALRSPDLSEQTLIQALELSDQAGNVAIQTKLNWNLMLNYLHSRRLDQAFEYGQRALVSARQAADKEQLAFVLNDFGRVYTCRGDFDSALAVITEARALWRQLENRIMLADNLGAEEEALFALGRYADLIKVGNQALEICDAIDNPWGKSYHRLLLSLAHFQRGEVQLAIRLSTEAVELGDRGGLIIATIAGRCDLAWFYGWCGARDKGLELIEEAIKITQENLPEWIALPLSIKVRLHALTGDVRLADASASIAPLEPVSIPYPHYTVLVREAEIERAFAKRDYARALKLTDNLLEEVDGIVRGEILYAECGRGDALMALGRFDEANQTLARAGTLARQQGSEQNLWIILASLARLHSTLGNVEEAKSNRAEARQIVEEIAEQLREIGLRELFLSQPRVEELLR
jgi:tetratricopeptide (TPR) repeat protein